MIERWFDRKPGDGHQHVYSPMWANEREAVESDGNEPPTIRCVHCGQLRDGTPPPTEEQPAPTPGTGDMWRLVMSDMEARRDHGIETYGTPLQAFNGRDALTDLYQELLDAVVYLRQFMLERDDDFARVVGWQVHTNHEVDPACREFTLNGRLIGMCKLLEALNQ